MSGKRFEPVIQVHEQPIFLSAAAMAAGLAVRAVLARLTYLPAYFFKRLNVEDLALWLVVALSGATQILAQEPAAGQIASRIVCRNDPGQSYALYLPSNYSPDQKWPILYALDAGARGSLPVERFREGAEKYGYIVAGSNNSRNGPIGIVEKAVNALLADTESRFSLDGSRIYLTGFSGGARVAVSAGFSLAGRVAGIIACGAGFPSEIKSPVTIPFAFFGIIGTEDFNFPELVDLDQALERSGAAHRLEIFQGGHEWPPEAVCTRALEWLEIQAMKSGIRRMDEARMDAIFAGAIAQARACESAQQPYEAFLRYSALAKDFAGLREVTAFAGKAAELGGSRAVKDARAREQDTAAKQRRAETELQRLLADAVAGSDRAFALQKLVSSLDALRRQADQTRSEANHRAAVRVLTRFWIQLSEETSLDLEIKNYKLATMRLELMAQIQPDNPQVYFHLARAHSLRGDRKNAIAALRNAVRRGFKDYAAMQGNSDFLALRNDPEFQKILADLEKK